jgi:hypothetical protein
MFQRATSFSQALNLWDDVIKVSDMSMMFDSESDMDFNQPLNNLNVSSVISMSWMFGGAKFPISH